MGKTPIKIETPVYTFGENALTIKDRIKTLANPNSMAFDESTGLLFVGHKPSRSMTVIRAASGKIEGNLKLDGIPEFPVSDNTGHICVNIDDKSEIAKIDTKSMTVTDHWPLGACKSPSGLALDEAKRRLFTACDNKLMAVEAVAFRNRLFTGSGWVGEVGAFRLG